MPMIERGGIASVYVDGALYEVGATIELKLGGVVRTAKVGSDRVAGFTTRFEAPEATLMFIDGPAVSVAAIKAIRGQTLQLRLNNGKTYQLYNATQVDDPTVKIADGEIDGVKFTGDRMQEIPA